MADDEGLKARLRNWHIQGGSLTARDALAAITERDQTIDKYEDVVQRMTDDYHANQDTLAALRAENARLREQLRWRGLKEPFGDEDEYIVWWSPVSGPTTDYQNPDCTHWLPLPPLPHSETTS